MTHSRDTESRETENDKRPSAVDGVPLVQEGRPTCQRPDCIRRHSKDPLVLILAYPYGKDRHIRQTLRACNGRYCGGSHAYVRRNPPLSAFARDCESSAAIHYSE